MAYTVEKAERPIIWIAHSLGGLLLKKALCLSEQSADPLDQQLHIRTIGIAFMGTPHQGSRHASIASVLASTLKSAGLHSSSKLTNSLEMKSQVLADVDASFAIWLRKNNQRLNIINFYEELEVVGLGIVSLLSSILLPTIAK